MAVDLSAGGVEFTASFYKVLQSVALAKSTFVGVMEDVEKQLDETQRKVHEAFRTNEELMERQVKAAEREQGMFFAVGATRKFVDWMRSQGRVAIEEQTKTIVE